MRRIVRFLLPLLAVAIVSPAPSVSGQATPSRVEVAPEALDMAVGESVQLTATVRDADGDVVEDAELLWIPVWGQFWNLERNTWGFNLFRVSQEGVVTASHPGEYSVRVRVIGAGSESEGWVEAEVPLRIRRPGIATVEIVDPPEVFYAGTGMRLEVRAVDRAGAVREDVTPRFVSSNPEVVTVDDLGTLEILMPGEATVTASAGEATTELPVHAVASTAARLHLEADRTEARTGDVVRLVSRILDADGNAVPDAPVTYSFAARTPAFVSGGPGSGLITPDGRFVADLPGEYVLVATSGSLADRVTLRVAPRDVKREVQLVGHGRVDDRATSDLWVWEGLDGRDYAITGTHSAEGHAYIWDVTDPSSMTIVDSVQVDARTVNDVKVSEDGRVAVISREGASNRRNGIVLLDVSAPRDGVSILSSFDDELTGGVHNVFVYDQHVYALSAGQRYDIISIEDPASPHRVGRFELDHPARSIHDVWVADGIAYSANWNHGVVMVDVGGGGMGGSPRQPVMMGQFPFPTGWNHAVYPYRSASTGTFYLFAGDEAARTGSFSPKPEIGTGTPGYEGEPARWRGWVHVLEWEPGSGEQPRMVARYEVPEAGSHNIWVQDDVMYVAFYNGGLRVVDVSGELLGDLYRQGREIARFHSFDPEGFQPNSPQVWGAQPFKGNVFFSDYNSGLWAVKLVAPASPNDDADARRP